MNIYASDLDQTLIYSRKWIKGLENEVSIIEEKDGEIISYIHNNAKEELIELSNKNIFIPVTTRTLEQYNRIDFSFLCVKYAITTNGGYILENGKVNKEWQNKINSELSKYPSIKDMKKKLKKLLKLDSVKKFRIADEMFFYIVVDEEMFEHELIKEYKKEFENNNWTIVDQGKKIYFMPKVLSKGNALKFLKERLGSKYVVSSGDSILDLSLKEVSNDFLIPGHSKIDTLSKIDEKGISSGYKLIFIANNILNCVD